MKKFLLFISFASPIIVLSCNPSSYDLHKEIVDIHDGDTFTLKSGEKIRLFGVDTPEISSEESNNQWLDTNGIEHDYALKAKNFASKKILSAKSISWKKMTSDRYGRTVAKIFADGQDLSKALVQEGLARVAYFSNEQKNPYFTQDMSYIKELLDLQCQAFLSEKGF